MTGSSKCFTGDRLTDGLSVPNTRIILINCEKPVTHSPQIDIKWPSTSKQGERASRNMAACPVLLHIMLCKLKAVLEFVIA